MSSHSRRHSRKEAKKKLHRRKQTYSTPGYRPTPWAPGELDAMLGYGTSTSFPLFMQGTVSLIKKWIHHQK